RAALRAAVPGHVRPHHRVLLQQHLRVVETLPATIAELDAAITAALAPYRPAVAHLVTISRREHDGGADPGRGDRRRPEPLPERGASDLLGGAVSAPGRERGEAPLDTSPQGSPVAQARPRPRRLGRGPGPRKLSPGPVPAPQTAPRADEGRRRGG